MDFADEAYGDQSQADAAALLDGLLRVAQGVRLRSNEWLGRFQLNDGRHAVLMALASANDNGCSQAELAVKLGQSESNISTLIERMQRDGLVDRSRSEADRRKRVLLISAAGRRTLASVDVGRSAWAARLLKGIPVDNQRQLFGLLQQLGTSLEAPLPTQALPKPTTYNRLISAETESVVDPTDDPQSPQFALQQMLLALSSSAGVESNVKDVA